MRIGIDISTVLNHGKDVGAGRYIMNLVKSLCEVDQDDEFVLTGRYITDEYLGLAEELKQHFEEVNAKLPKIAYADCAAFDENNGRKNTSNDIDKSGNRHSADVYSTETYSKARHSTGKLSFKLIKTTQRKLDLSNKYGFPPIELYGFKADVFHCPDFLIAPTLNNKIVLTIHDLAFIRFPQFNFDWFVKKYTNLVRRNASIAAAIIADSQSTKNDIVEFFGIKEEKVTVIHLAADEIFKKLNASEIDHSIASKYKITKKFLLSTGTIEPRKNYVTLIKAFNRLKIESGTKHGHSSSSGLLYSSKDSKSTGNNGDTENHNKLNNPSKHKFYEDLQLVIVGRTGWMSEPAIAEYNNSPYKDDIILAGRLSDAELVQLYNMAELFVYPSVFEGFGLPVVEAMQCGLPVVASNSSSIPELIDDKRLLFNPADEKDIADKINLVLGNDKLKTALAKDALKNAAKFSWKNTAQKILEVYRKL